MPIAGLSESIPTHHYSKIMEGLYSFHAYFIQENLLTVYYNMNFLVEKLMSHSSTKYVGTERLTL